jgi:hypothetical protein
MEPLFSRQQANGYPQGFFVKKAINGVLESITLQDLVEQQKRLMVRRDLISFFASFCLTQPKESASSKDQGKEAKTLR